MTISINIIGDTPVEIDQMAETSELAELKLGPRFVGIGNGVHVNVEHVVTVTDSTQSGEHPRLTLVDGSSIYMPAMSVTEFLTAADAR